MNVNSPKAKSLAHRPALTLRELDHLDYLAKIRHWQREDAWSPGGNRLRFENPKYGIADLQIVDGNIVRATPLVGRPCFGIATALLRYEHATRFVPSRGHLPNSRCLKCKAKDACVWVVTNRLKSHTAIEKAWTDWLKEGGQQMFARPDFKKSYGHRLWVALCRELSRHPFTSVNDQQVAAAYLEQDRTNREKDRDRKAMDRRRARREGDIDKADEELLKRAARERAIALVNLREGTECPPELERIPRKSLKEMMEVWLGREILRARKMKGNAPDIARWIAATGRSNTSKNHAALCSRVTKDLQRIAKLEKLSWQGKILLPQLDHRNEFSSHLDD